MKINLIIKTLIFCSTTVSIAQGADIEMTDISRIDSVGNGYSITGADEFGEIHKLSGDDKTCIKLATIASLKSHSFNLLFSTMPFGSGGRNFSGYGVEGTAVYQNRKDLANEFTTFIGDFISDPVNSSKYTDDFTYTTVEDDSVKLIFSAKIKRTGSFISVGGTLENESEVDDFALYAKQEFNNKFFSQQFGERLICSLKRINN